jgi:hypothetical protein
MNIGKPMSAWQAYDQPPADYLRQIEKDPVYTARFTRKLHEIHSSLAEQLAGMLDLQGTKRMLCDVGSFGESLFRRIHGILNRMGRLVIVDKFAPSQTGVPSSRLFAAFLAALESPAESIDYITTDVVQTQLHQAGFRNTSITSVPHKDNLPWNMDWTMLEAQKE